MPIRTAGWPLSRSQDSISPTSETSPSAGETIAEASEVTGRSGSRKKANSQTTTGNTTKPSGGQIR
jgi:hypothetical protein